jgi:hypothetical protein
MIYRKTLIILFVWISIFLAMTAFVVFGFIKIEKMKKIANSVEQEIVQEKESLQAFESLIKTTSSIKTDSEKINSFYIKRAEVINFINKIESLASTTNTQLSIQRVVDKKMSTNGTLLFIDISAHGSYSNLHYLIRLLEELPYQTEIQNIKLSKGSFVDEEKQSMSSWSADINIVGIML